MKTARFPSPCPPKKHSLQMLDNKQDRRQHHPNFTGSARDQLQYLFSGKARDHEEAFGVLRLVLMCVVRVCSKRDRWEVRISITSAGAVRPSRQGQWKWWRCRQSPDRWESRKETESQGGMRTGDGKEEEVRRGARASPRIPLALAPLSDKAHRQQSEEHS